jgi:signal transduction histidine kinase
VRAGGYLASAMAHEVRNPLNSMAIHVELLTTRLPRAAAVPASAPTGGAPAPAEAAAHSLAVLRHEIERIDGILQRYLEYAGAREGERRPVAVDALLAAALERAAEVPQRGLRVELEPTPARWTTDEDAVALALDELLVNAAEASPRGAVVRVRATESEGCGVIEVIDHGEGIAAEALPQLFHLGYSTRPGHGGLGLTVAKQAIKGLGGSLVLRSDGPGQGAVARIELPLDEE